MKSMKMVDDPLAFEGVAGLAARMRARSLSPVTLIDEALGRIRRLDGRLHAFIALTPDRAMAEARAAESVLASGRDAGPLLGMFDFHRNKPRTPALILNSVSGNP